MEIGMKSPPSVSDGLILVLEPVATTVERSVAGDSYDITVLSQQFEGHGGLFTRVLTVNSEVEEDEIDETVLGLECQALGLAGLSRRNLHRLVRRFAGQHRMAVVDDGRGGCLIVLEEVEAKVRALVAARGAKSGSNPPTTARRATS